MPLKVSILTLTGARPEAFALCEKYVKRQRALTLDSEYEFEWIIVDDGGSWPGMRLPEHENLSHAFYIPNSQWQAGENTFNRNLAYGLKYCTGELIAFMEDDDWYSPHYLLCMLDVWRTANLKPRIIGSSPAEYYNVRTGEHKILDNIFHASLAETIIHRSLVPVCQSILKQDQGITFFDVQLWREARMMCPGDSNYWLGAAGHSIGIKGMPGRRGIGVGHLDHPEWEKDDLEFSYLRRLIGNEDAEAYKKYREAL